MENFQLGVQYQPINQKAEMMNYKQEGPQVVPPMNNQMMMLRLKLDPVNRAQTLLILNELEGPLLIKLLILFIANFSN